MVESRVAKRLPKVVLRLGNLVGRAEGIQTRIAWLQPVVQRTIEVHAQIQARAEAGARQRCAVQGAWVIGIQQLENGVPMCHVSSRCEQNCAGSSFDLAEGRPGGWRVPERAEEVSFKTK